MAIANEQFDSATRVIAYLFVRDSINWKVTWF